jgi:DNA-binding GntR family transcriptional regulator
MPGLRKHRPNLSEIAYDELKEMILTGELAQGERIILEKMSEKLNLSITPLREALNKLAQDDLIRATPRSSYEVISLDSDDISDILDLREMLEIFALRTWGENLAQFPVQAFRDVFAKLKGTSNHRKFVETDIKFHEVIASLTKNRKLVKLYSYIRNPERLLMVPSAKIEGRMDQAIEEHQKILDAIQKKDLDLATKRLSAHIQKVKTLLLQIHKKPGAGIEHL